MKGRATGGDRHGDIPLWGTMWLQEQWRGGRKVHEIARELGVHADTVQRWKSQHGHRVLGS